MRRARRGRRAPAESSAAAAVLASAGGPGGASHNPHAMYPGPSGQSASESMLRWSRRRKDTTTSAGNSGHTRTRAGVGGSGPLHTHTRAGGATTSRARINPRNAANGASRGTNVLAPPLRYSHADLRVAGWLSKRGKRLGTRVERFVTLRGCILANARAEGARPSWAINVRGAKVHAGESREIVIGLQKTSVSFYAPSDDAHARWLKALQAVSASVFDFYDKGKLIGRGAYSEVYLGRDKIRSELCAIKVLQRPDAEHAKLIDREVMVLHMLNHHNIVQIYDIFDTATKTYVVMEFLAGGELLDLITENDHLPERSAKHVIREVLQAIYYLHVKGIVHRDVKPENILCVGRTWPLHVKLTDFGLSRIVQHSGDGSDRVMRSQCGTAYYLAPEIAHNLDYGKPVDLWACGVVLYVMLAGKFPFYGDTDEKFMRRLRAGVKFPDKEWAAVSVDAKALVRGLLDPCPASRLTAEQALQHRWLVSDEHKSLTSKNSTSSRQVFYKNEPQSMPYMNFKPRQDYRAPLSASEVSEEGDVMRTDHLTTQSPGESRTMDDLPSFITPVSTLGDVQSEGQLLG